MNGTFDLQDRQALETAKPIFRWAAENQQYYVGQESAARVLLLGGGGDAYRGMFRLLTEEHIPFAISDNLEWIGKREFDLVVAADRAPAALKPWVEGGGKLLIATATPPAFEVAPVVRTVADVKGYVRIRDKAAYPSLKDADLLMLNGPFTETGGGRASLTLIPPSMIGPPEFIHIDMKDTDTPAIVERAMGKGSVVWLPWNLGAMYHRLSLPAHAGLIRDTLARLHPRRQLVTDAHPLVEMTLMRQGGRTLLHLINLSGHSQTGYFAPVPMGPIKVAVDGAFTGAKTVRGGETLKVLVGLGRTQFTIPGLRDYELIVLASGR
jgi:hypothetical protein